MRTVTRWSTSEYVSASDSGDNMIKESTEGQAKDDLILTFDQVQLWGKMMYYRRGRGAGLIFMLT